MAKQETPILDLLLLAVTLIVIAGFIVPLAVLVAAVFVVAAAVCLALTPFVMILKAWRVAPSLTIIAAIVAFCIYLHLR